MAKYQCKTQSAIPTDEGATTATAKSAGGRLGNSATRQQNKAIGDYLQQKGWTVTGGGGQVKLDWKNSVAYNHPRNEMMQFARRNLTIRPKHPLLFAYDVPPKFQFRKMCR